MISSWFIIIMSSGINNYSIIQIFFIQQQFCEQCRPHFCEIFVSAMSSKPAACVGYFHQYQMTITFKTKILFYQKIWKYYKRFVQDKQLCLLKKLRALSHCFEINAEHIESENNIINPWTLFQGCSHIKNHDTLSTRDRPTDKIQRLQLKHNFTLLGQLVQ